MKAKDRQTFEVVYKKLHIERLSPLRPGTCDEREREFIRLLGRRAALVHNSCTIDGERLAHRLQLEAARRALSLVWPDATDLEQAPIRDLQWALADLELGRVRPSLKPPPHRKKRGNKPDSMETLTFKACCLKAALLLRAAGDSKLKADATVINQVAVAARNLGLRTTTIPVSTYGEPRSREDRKRRGTTLDGWRRAHLARKSSKGNLHVSWDTELGVPLGWPMEEGIGTDRQAAKATFLGKDKECSRHSVKWSWGLMLAIAPNGRKTWQYRDTDGSPWHTLGSYPDMKLAQARKAYEKVRGELDTDRHAEEAKFRGKDKEPTRYPVKASLGLVLAVTPRGRKSWQYWFRKDDSEHWAWRTLGTFPSMSLTTARKKHQQLCRNLANRLLAFLNLKYGDMQS